MCQTEGLLLPLAVLWLTCAELELFSRVFVRCGSQVLPPQSRGDGGSSSPLTDTGCCCEPGAGNHWKKCLMCPPLLSIFVSLEQNIYCGLLCDMYWVRLLLSSKVHGVAGHKCLLLQLTLTGILCFSHSKKSISDEVLPSLSTSTTWIFASTTTSWK